MGTTMVSPSGGWVHVKPASILQSEEHPSPLTALPSSHCSPPSTSPSPHLVAHPPPPGGQLGSAMQVGVQPSPRSLFFVAGSHPSAPSTLPSPQTVLRQLVSSHTQPGFTEQFELHA